MSMLKRVVDSKREAVCVAASAQKGRALEDGELDQVVGGFGLGLPMVGPQSKLRFAGRSLRAVSEHRVARRWRGECGDAQRWFLRLYGGW